MRSKIEKLFREENGGLEGYSVWDNDKIKLTQLDDHSGCVYHDQKTTATHQSFQFV